MVEARPSALLDSTHQVASGLPSMIHDGSIGRGVRSTVNLAISINSRDIKNLWRPEAFGNSDLHANGRPLKLSLRIASQSPEARAILRQKVARFTPTHPCGTPGRGGRRHQCH